MAPVYNAFIAILSLHLLVIPFSVHALSFLSTSYDNPIATAPNNWTVSLSSIPYQLTPAKSYKIIFRMNLPLGSPSFAAGFYCFQPCKTYLFAVFIIHVDSGGNEVILPVPTEVVWSANRAHPVSENATLRLTSDSGLSLHDSNGSLAWSTNVNNHSVAGINITEFGNLVLFDQNNSTIWQSFDHPTDTLLMGQKLTVGASLTANVSATNWSEGQVHLTLVANGLHAFVDLNPPQLYFIYDISGNITEKNPGYLKLTNGSLDMFLSFPNHGKPDGQINLTYASSESKQYIRLESDGHLKLYDSGIFVKDVLSNLSGDIRGIPNSCGYPTICGHYGICKNGNCRCPNDTYFQQDENNEEFNFSCSPLTPISCQDNQSHILVPLGDIAYFNYIDDNGAAFKGLGEEHCKNACLQNCSCKAALFSYFTGGCYLPSEVFTLMDEQLDLGYFQVYNSSANLKVQLPLPPPPPISSQSPPISKTSAPPKSAEKVGFGRGAILGSVFGGLLLLLFIIGTVWVLLRRGEEEEEQDYIDELPGLPTRFSLQELEVATENFSKKLGEGGFGTVFEGSLGNEKVAVKRLEGVERAKKEFLAEVQIIGGIHHINLVNLTGFCAEKSKRLLVYEYMCNGSLDKWIYRSDGRTCLNWRTKHKIITDIAKGLCYLHEGCRQRILHLDIKPQNILLDENFNAKVADFGLCKLMDRDKSKLDQTRMRGTPGYLAPEWLTAMITEKVDVYSFGVVIMEILCGRRNLDYSQTEENRHLITLLEVKSKDNELFDLIDKSVEDFEVHKEEIMHLMELAMWCLQSDSTRRPSMSVAVQVLEGAMEVETSLDYNFVSSIPIIATADIDVDQSVPLVASVLSGPR